MPSKATLAYREATADGWPFDSQRDAYEAGYEAALAMVRERLDDRRKWHWDDSYNGYVWFNDLYDFVSDEE